jgi:2,3-bisphosphoglycerate-independent phosphoglycerate mutase
MGRHVLFVFLDGVGLAPAGPDNPFSQANMPCLVGLLGGPLVLDGVGQPVHRCQRTPPSGDGGDPSGRVVVRALDACLGVPGLPQSATGQAALFTGVNAPALVGDHVTAFPTERLRDLIARQSLLKRAAEAGARVLFANAHSERFWQMIREGKRRLGASTLAALAAGGPIPTLADLADGRAVLWDVTNEVASRFLGYELPIVAPELAGARLAQLSAEYDLVLYESFLPDLAGHGRLEPDWVLVRIDALLGGILASLPPGVTLVVSSDHGNLEDVSTKHHTTNPVPLLSVGPDAGAFRAARAITDVAGAILSVLRCAL